MNTQVIGTRGAFALLALAVLAMPAVSFAYSSGPPDGRTGAPGESTCVVCHNSFPLDSGSGTLSIGGIGSSYVPNQTYHVEITLDDPDASRWGFEATAYREGVMGMIGTFTPVDGSTQVTDFFPQKYVKHTSAGTFAGQTGSATWMFDWTAPDVGFGSVAIYVAANAANGNFNTQGDYIYTTFKALTEIVANEASSWGKIKSLYR